VIQQVEIVVMQSIKVVKSVPEVRVFKKNSEIDKLSESFSLHHFCSALYQIP